MELQRLTLQDVVDEVSTNFNMDDVTETVIRFIENLTPAQRAEALMNTLLAYNDLAGKLLSTRSRLTCLEKAVMDGDVFEPGTANIKLPEGLPARLRK